jgi:hypothetical protein
VRSAEIFGLMIDDPTKKANVPRKSAVEPFSGRPTGPRWRGGLAYTGLPRHRGPVGLPLKNGACGFADHLPGFLPFPKWQTSSLPCFSKYSW